MSGEEKARDPQEVADVLAQEAFGISRSTAREARICVSCKKPPGDFRDDVSRKEWAISQLCQGCQDVVFAEPPE